MTAPLTVESREEKGIQIVTLKGRMVALDERNLEGILLPFVSNPGARVVVDLGAVDRIDSRGLGALVQMVCRANIAQGKVAFARPSAHVSGVLEVTRLDAFLTVRSDLDAARQAIRD